MTEKFEKYNHVLLYKSQNIDNITLGITTREQGISPYPQNAFNMARYIDDDQNNVTQHQRQLAEIINYPREQWVFPIQTHENRVAHITQSQRGTNIDELTDALHGIDAMYSYDSDVLLTMCYADCVPIYFYSAKNNFIALAHAGWRGTVSEIVIEVIKKIDFDLQELSIVIGPATSNSYEINEDIKSKFDTLAIPSEDYIEFRAGDRYGIDLKQANKLLLMHAGVPEANIYITNYATSEDLSLFFSYRVEQGKTGRMLAFIGQ
ncbi:peptidoglycan editing factor PgeF [Staphylococcus sp. GDY8P100P]|uniref:peptidoglycan editing factor PgeF n=1 Tax=Staphylococcus sp. GDY8P100P TaxID=2804429 RepID=UPI0019529305|nr:peptidoglycan editing factor PgeF [Staphylococcus sp. GDY8P100P]